MKKFLTVIFHGIDRTFLVRSYLISICMTVIIIYLLTHGTRMTTFAFLWMGLNMVLYPFSDVVWTDGINFLFGNNIFLYQVSPVWIVVWKLIKVFLLYMLAVFIAPVGLIYVYLANRHYFD
jgi:hypothetical protein